MRGQARSGVVTGACATRIGPLALLCATFGASAPSAPARAQGACVLLEARFVESAPRDRFEFQNRAPAGIEITDILLVLTDSAGKLIFDTLEGGSGVEVFQPYRTESGDARLASVVRPDDGAERLALAFERFSSGDSFSFSIDVDDRLTDSELGQIRVSDSEIDGATLRIGLHDAQGVAWQLAASFGADARAVVIDEPPCSDG